MKSKGPSMETCGTPLSKIHVFSYNLSHKTFFLYSKRCENNGKFVLCIIRNNFWISEKKKILAFLREVTVVYICHNFSCKLDSHSMRTNALHENCPNTEFFLVPIFPYSVRMRKNRDQKKLLTWTIFTQW